MIPEVKPLSIGSKKTITLKLTPEQYNLVSGLFDGEGRPISKELDYSIDCYKWTLYRSKPIIGTEGQNLGYHIYGVCGDSTFGSIPWYHRTQYAGNIRAARKVYSQFIEKYFIKKEHLIYEFY